MSCYNYYEGLNLVLRIYSGTTPLVVTSDYGERFEIILESSQISKAALTRLSRAGAHDPRPDFETRPRPCFPQLPATSPRLGRTIAAAAALTETEQDWMWGADPRVLRAGMNRRKA